MPENFDSLTYLLLLLVSGCSVNEYYELLAQLNPEQWDALLDEADNQEVAPYLYSLLADLEKTQHLEIPRKETLRISYLSTAARNTITLHDAEILLNAFQKAGIPAVA